MNKSDYYKVGFIKRPHGLTGEVTIIPDNTFPVEWDNIKSIMVELKGRLVPYFIESISTRPDKFFVKFEDVDSPEEASKLKGCALFLSKETRAELSEGDFYDDEVIGFEVFDDRLGLIGKVKEIEQAGPNRFLLVDYHNKGVMIPAKAPLIVEIDKMSKKIVVTLPEGILDL